MTKMIPLLPKIVLLYFVLGGIFGLGVGLVPDPPSVSHAVSLSIVKQQTKHIPLVHGEPVRVEIPRLGIQLAVRGGEYDKATKTWELVSNDAYYALTSHLPNNKYGNTVIYGHNNNDVFGKTKGLELYDELVITTSNGRKFTYVYMDREITNPDNTEIFTTETAGPRVTLLTCAGTWNQRRRLMVFEYSEVD